jgi:UDP-4-amino-4,6-dideoxy-N-acetyl-beta-L-altrosamine N-acetyltransferase
MNLKLRKIEDCELSKIMTWRMNPKVTKFMNTDPMLDIEMQKKWFFNIEKDATKMNFMIEAGSVAIGVFQLVDIDKANKNCAWQWYIGEDEYRGKGIGSKLQPNIFDFVFMDLKLHKLWSHVLCFNEKEIPLHEKHGYRIEGRLKDHIYKNGEYIDVLCFGMTEEIWQSERQKIKYEPIIIEKEHIKSKIALLQNE